MILIGFNMWHASDQSKYGGTYIICLPHVGQAVPKLKRYVPSLSYPVYYTHTHRHTYSILFLYIHFKEIIPMTIQIPLPQMKYTYPSPHQEMPKLM